MGSLFCVKLRFFVSDRLLPFRLASLCGEPKFGVALMLVVSYSAASLITDPHSELRKTSLSPCLGLV